MQGLTVPFVLVGVIAAVLGGSWTVRQLIARAAQVPYVPDHRYKYVTIKGETMDRPDARYAAIPGAAARRIEELSAEPRRGMSPPAASTLWTPESGTPWDAEPTTPRTIQ